jgi:hypothetical protein
MSMKLLKVCVSIMSCGLSSVAPGLNVSSYVIESIDVGWELNGCNNQKQKPPVFTDG